MLTQIAEDIWTVSGPEITAALGFHYPTRMAVIRLRDGSLFIWSPVALSDDLAKSVDRLGPVQHILAPNSLHHMSIPDWASVYPEATLYAAPKLAAKRPDIRFDQEIGTGTPPTWADEIAFVIVEGNAITTEVVLFHRKSGTVLVTDLIQQMPQGWYSGWRAIVAKLDLMVASEPTVPRKFRMAFKNKPAARKAVAEILEWPAEAVLMAHAPPVRSDARAFLKRAFDWLMP
ncbi:DUF4336 domain-containing protein [Flavimaricola marinus]|uniref:DUF4336 domain-containing protein n=1 Tax=Flavimaricola marinus TaxID=1819565 RepID=A0A238LCW8_9RHOB|nr:DUF4336 domain-containing protein [Flavimaricola marinus]SMY07461.1 hypothetical protein LOM8899_01596 [Flavimaricola marinus]